MDKKQLELLEAEQAAFNAQLPTLLDGHSGEFAVFHGGELFGTYPSYDDAYRAALAEFGIDEVFLISLIGPPPTQASSVSFYAGVLW